MVEWREYQFANFARSTLAAGVSAEMTQLELVEGEADNFPDPIYGEVFSLILSNGAQYEIAYCTARTGRFLTVERGKESTTALEFAVGATVVHNATAGFFEQVVATSPIVPPVPPNPVPVITSLDSTPRAEDLGDFTLTVTGTDFVSDSVVRWDGVDRSTTYISATQLQAAILSADVDDPGTFSVTVFNPPSVNGGGGVSNTVVFTVTDVVTYAVWDPATAGANIALSGGDLTATRSGSGTWQSVRATISKSSGKWYWEYVITSVQENDVILGAADSTQSASNFVGHNLGGYGVQSADAANAVLKYHNGSAGAFASAPTRRWQQNDVIMVALDADNDMIWFGFNGDWALESGAPPNPVTQTGPSFTVVTAALFGAVSMFSAQSVTANFGATPLAYSPPSGFNAGLYNT